jgi:hypothetical protein
MPRFDPNPQTPEDAADHVGQGTQLGGEGGEDLDVVAEAGLDEEESAVDYLGMATAALNALAAGGAACNAPLAWRVRAPLLDANGGDY